VSGLSDGDPEAVSDFLTRTHHPVYCIACRLTRDPEHRRDWCHQVLLGILDDLKRGRFVYTRPGSFWAWFRKRAYYRLLDEYRRQRHLSDREVGDSNDPTGRGIETLHPGEDPSVELERAEVLTAIELCINKLPNPQQRQALGMLLFQQMDYQAIADRMSAPLNTVKAWIRRARLAVRKCLIQALALTDDASDG